MRIIYDRDFCVYVIGPDFCVYLEGRKEEKIIILEYILKLQILVYMLVLTSKFIPAP